MWNLIVTILRWRYEMCAVCYLQNWQRMNRDRVANKKKQLQKVTMFCTLMIQLFATIFSHLTFLLWQTKNILLRTINSMFIFFAEKEKKLGEKTCEQKKNEIEICEMESPNLRKCLLVFCSCPQKLDVFVMFSILFMATFLVEHLN